MICAEVTMPSLTSEIDELYEHFDVIRARAVDRALRRACEAEPSLSHLEEANRLCLLYAHFSSPVDGYAAARVAVRAARRLGDAEQLRRAFTTRGALRLMAGDINGAIEDNVEAYKLARDLNDEAIAASPLSNLVFALGLIDLDDLALRLAEPAIDRLPPESALFAHLNAATSLMVNASDLLLGKDPRRALRLACEAERRLVAASSTSNASDGLVVATRLAGSLVNQVIASMNLGDRELASAAVSRLQRLVGDSAIPRLRQVTAVALAAFEARYGNERRGLSDLKLASESCVDEAAVDASRRLIEYYEATGRPEEAASALRALQARLQTMRRSVGLEELRRIDALDEVGEFDEFTGETEKRLQRYGVFLVGDRSRVSAKLQLLEGIAISAEVREGADMSRAQHPYRVGKLCFELARESGISAALCCLAEVAGRLHDIGKCAIPDTAILSTAPLSKPMRDMLREHADYGARLIADADEPSLIQVVAAVRHHHERFDGKGYPNNLSGDDIPVLARIVAICETYDAMLQSRVYRSSRTPANALEEVERCAGTQFDPLLAGLFVRVVRRLQRENGDIVEYLGSEAHRSTAVRAFDQLERLMIEDRMAL